MKNYRIVRVAPLHFVPLMQEFYENNPELKTKSYAEQQKALFEMAYLYSDSFSRGMRILGNESHEIVCDLEPMQKTWALEKGIRYDSEHWRYDIVLKQIEDIRPDVVYVQSHDPLPYSIRRNLKEYFPFIKLVVLYTGFPGAFNELDDVDVLLVASPRLVKQYSDAGLMPNLIYLSFDESVLEKTGDDNCNTKYDFTFIGSSGFGYGLTKQARYWDMVELIEKTPLEAWIYEKKNFIPSKIYAKHDATIMLRELIKKYLGYCDTETLNRVLNLSLPPDKLKRMVTEVIEEISEKQDTDVRLMKSIERFLNHFDRTTLSKILSLSLPDKLRRVIIKVLEQRSGEFKQNYFESTDLDPRLPITPLCKMFPTRCHTPVFGIEMLRVLRDSKVTFNKHTDDARDTASNLRLFQATGMGACLLTDTGSNMADLFEEDRELVVYSSIEDCIEKVNYLLEHDDIRQQIAEAGQKRTLKDHTMVKRCRQVNEIIQKKL